MSECMCQNCAVIPAPTYTEQFKIECLARYLLRAKTLEERREFIEKYGGDKQALRNELMRQHKERARR